MSFIVEDIEEQLPSTALRNVTRGGVKALTSAATLPLDVASGLASVEGGIENSLGKAMSNLGLGSIAGEQLPPMSLPSWFPTSSGIEQTIKSPIQKMLPPGYLEPQGPKEQKFDSFVSDVVSLATPMGPLKSLPLGRSMIASGLGQFAKWLAEEKGIGEAGQEGVKLGTMVLASTMGIGGLKEHMKNLYAKAEASIPEGATVNVRQLDPVFTKVRKVIQKGAETESKEFMNKHINALESKIINGKIPVDEAWQFKRDFNEIIGGKKKLTGVAKYLPEINHELKKSLEAYGKTNKAFGTAFSAGDDIYKASAISRFLEKAINPTTLSAETVGLLMKGHGVIGTAMKVGGTALIPQAVKGFEILKNSPAARHYYGNVISQAAKKNIPATLKAVGGLDKAVRNQVKKTNSRFVIED